MFTSTQGRTLRIPGHLVLGQNRAGSVLLVEDDHGGSLRELTPDLGDLDREAVRKLYQQATLCVAASRREGFGLTPLEAMASGCAVLTSGAGVWPMVVDSVVGRRFETGRLDDLIEKLRTLLADPGQLLEMGCKGRERVESKHSLDQEADAINRLYLDLGGAGVTP